MEILYISPSVIPSLEANSIHVMKMCQAFCQLGHTVELIAKDKPSPIVVENLWDHYGVSEKFQINRLKVSAISREYDYGARAAYYAMRKPVDVVYSRNVLAAGLLSQAGKPTISEIHSENTGLVNKTGFAMLSNGSGLRRLVVITRSLSEHLFARGINPKLKEKLLICPDGVDLERFENLPDANVLKNHLHIPEDSFVIGYSGHLYEGRGTDLILQMAGNFPRDTVMIMGGDEQEVIMNKEYARQKNLTNVIFTGFVANSILPGYLSLCDVLLMPYQRKVITSRGSNTVSWMSPLKMFEYMASGKVILSSDLPVLHEVLDEKNCLFCDPEDIHSWVNAIQLIKDNPVKGMSLAAQAKIDVRKYTWKERAKRILDGI